jgi:hypothetical protein
MKTLFYFAFAIASLGFSETASTIPGIRMPRQK